MQKATFSGSIGLGFLGLVAACASSEPSAPSAGAGGGKAGTLAAEGGSVAPEPAGSSASAGAGTTGAAAGMGAAGTSSSMSAGSSGVTGTSGAGSSASDQHFSFFVASWAAMQRLSGSPNGFGGDLRFGKADGLSGADEICRQIADAALPGAGQKTWHAFLSVTKGPDGTPVNAIDRVGEGPWYDRLGRLIAMNKTALAQARPSGADSAIINDLPNEDGVPNHAPDGSMQVDNHDVLTGSSTSGTLYQNDWSVTCHDWTSSVGSDGKPRVGHSWIRMGGGRGGQMGGMVDSWMSSLTEAGCAAGASLVEMGGPIASNPTVGSGGGYGAIYCFALTP